MVAPEGVIVGGWNYVFATYAIGLLGLGAYTVVLLIRLRRANDENSPPPDDAAL